MKFICEKETLLTSIGQAKEFTTSRSSLSISSNVFLKTVQNSLELRTTDNNLGFVTYINVKTIEEGETTVDCERLLDVLKGFSDISDIIAETKEDILIVQPGGNSEKKFNFDLKTIESSEFPTMKNADDLTFFDFNSADLTDMIKQTSFAVSTDETRRFLCGLFMHRTETGINMVATDGKRLSIVERKISEEIPLFPPAIIPNKFIGCLKRFLSSDAKLELAITDNLIGARINENIFIYSALVNGTFPKYNKIIPGEQKNKCILNISDMKDAINRVSIFVLDKSNKIYLQLRENKLTISSDVTDQGKASEILECDYSGESCDIAINYEYLINPLNVMEGEYFSLNFDSPERSIKLIPETGSHDYFHIVMPIQQI
ncbi:MAG: DNA polymerase III subunit beta [Spirochaetia bacterium]|jgi:DNA polymerase-3 subunit beta|nr:DNA polymerase III subunit beta [Spirochaetia bacterium]